VLAANENNSNGVIAPGHNKYTDAIALWVKHRESGNVVCYRRSTNASRV
jgi:hypothetical protein